MARACCYVINPGYLFPTLLSAMQARAMTDRATTDILIFCIGEPSPETDLFSAICADDEIKLTMVPPRSVGGMPIMMARFFLTDLLDPAYGAVVYLDGDTQVAGSLEPLLDAHLDTGRFLAARDPMSIIIDTPKREWRDRRSYFQAIGLLDQDLQRYCNSGVIRFNRRDWGHISKAVLGMSSMFEHRLKFPDQDALNLMFGTDYLTMSYRWNFPIFFMNYRFETFIAPHVLHFMSNPRPWEGPFHPWGHELYSPYPRLLARFPALKGARRRLGRMRYLKYVLQQRYKYIIESPLWKSAEVLERVRRNEAEAYV